MTDSVIHLLYSCMSKQGAANGQGDDPGALECLTRVVSSMTDNDKEIIAKFFNKTLGH